MMIPVSEVVRNKGNQVSQPLAYLHQVKQPQRTGILVWGRRQYVNNEDSFLAAVTRLENAFIGRRRWAGRPAKKSLSEPGKKALDSCTFQNQQSMGKVPEKLYYPCHGYPWGIDLTGKNICQVGGKNFPDKVQKQGIQIGMKLVLRVASYHKERHPRDAGSAVFRM